MQVLCACQLSQKAGASSCVAQFQGLFLSTAGLCMFCVLSLHISLATEVAFAPASLAEAVLGIGAVILCFNHLKQL